jgi:GTP-binding protein
MMHHVFREYQPYKGDIPRRMNGVMISMVPGQVNGYALDNLQQRGTMFVKPGDPVYEGMIVAENARADDMSVNPIKEKKLTNMRASGSDKNILLKPPRLLTLELALEYIEDDEMVEVTPSSIRLRKKYLTEEARRRASGKGKFASV